MSEEEDLELQISFRPEYAAQAAVDSKYNPGFMASRVTRAKKGREKEKEELLVSPRFFRFEFTLLPLQDPEDPESGVGRGIPLYLRIPEEPPHWEEAAASGDLSEEDLEAWREQIIMATRNMHSFLHACFPENVPDLPRKVDGELMFEGEPISEEDAEAAKVQARQAAGDLMAQLWNEGPDDVIDCTFFHRLRYKDGSDFPNVDWFSPEHPTRKGQPVDLVENLMNKPDVSKAAASGSKKKKGSSKKKASSRKRK